ncbi:MAG: hypothetical protein CK604_06025 [Curvibacter sp. PD_MW3]|nr:MAG: hypothetical protein CK604_06025 [Curvibacter sp. PD_MW3]
MNKNVIIARPHPFIVESMKPFLEEAGFSVSKLGSIDEIMAQTQRSAGAIISLALSSPIQESAQEVFVRLRGASARTPVLFASMLPIEKIASTLEALAKNNGIAANILGYASPPSNWGSLGKPETFLYLSKADLDAADRRTILAQMTRRHFQ